MHYLRTNRRDREISRQFRFVFRMTVIRLFIRIRFCRMTTCRQLRARGTGGGLIGFVMYHRRFRWWASHRIIRVVIHDGQCGVRSIRQIFRVLICSSRFAWWPCLQTSDIPPGVGADDMTPVVRADDVPHVGLIQGRCPLIRLRR